MRKNMAASFRLSVLSAIPFELNTGGCSVLVISERGASRTPTNRRLLIQLLPAQFVQVSDSHEAVRAGPSLSPTTCAASGAGLATPPRIANPTAFQRKTHLAARDSDRTGSACRVTTHEVDIGREPLEDVASQPADPPAVKPLPSREATEQCQRSKDPAMSPREPGNVMGGQQLLEGGTFLIDPLRE